MRGGRGPCEHAPVINDILSARGVSAIVGLGAAAVLTLTAFAGSANAGTTSPQTLKQVPCRAYTFNVFHGTHSETCYEGRGTKVVRVSDVREITTGENSGHFEVIFHRTLVEIVKFTPKRTYHLVKPTQSEVFSITITRT
jgi:NAD(P)H-dependent flavin oxidoreductase YrpB (nitropropane dioxygenase family)